MNPRRNQFYRQKIDPLAEKYRKNEGITVPEVRLIDAEGNPAGVVTTAKALEMAKELELDLVEVAPTANPPVAKIISWSKFKYDHSKKNKSNTSRTQMKEVRFGALIGDNDRIHKTKRIKEFLMDKHMVKVAVRTPGRIKVDQSKLVMDKVLDDTYEYGELDGTVKFEGRSVVATLKPLKVKRQRPEDIIAEQEAIQE